MSKNFVYAMGLIAVQTITGCSYLNTKKESAEATASTMNSGGVRSAAGFMDAGVSGSDIKSPGMLAEFVRIQEKNLTKGSSPSEPGRNKEEGPQSVTLTKDFEIQKTEVTQAQWFLVMASNPSRFKYVSSCEDDHIEIRGTGLCPNHPVEMVSWDDVEKFIGKLNQGNDGYIYRLPTEAEWEYAARGGTQTAYFFGDEVESLGNYAWYSDNSGMRTHTVGSKSANQYKLYDMHGNVWEWVQDSYYESYPPESQMDPAGPASVSQRVIRGGSWSSNDRNLRSTARANENPESRYDNVGFRLVRTAK